MNYYLIGKISKTHGLKGDVKIINLSDFPRYEVGNTVYLKDEENYKKLIISRSFYQGNNLLVAFKNYEDINLIEKYRGYSLFVSDLEREELPSGEYYYSDLIGKNVYNEQDELKGNVSGVREVPQGHLLEVSHDDKISLVPVRDEFIKSVDKDKIIIKEIEGLF